GKSLGHVAAEAAVLLRGKQKVNYTPNVDCGDYVDQNVSSVQRRYRPGL
ncbi:50S ribosomal protein L13, partial [human gut metagenome]